MISVTWMKFGRRLIQLTLLLLACIVCYPAHLSGQEKLPSKLIGGIDGVEFFETKVEPILKQHCWKCHGDNPEKLGGRLALISSKSILHGGDSGPAVDLENSNESLLLQAINYEAYEMPPSGKLPAESIAILTKWVELRIPWTVDTANRMIESTEHAAPQVNEQSKSFWSFQKVSRPKLPEIENSEWITNDIDRFVLKRLEAAGLEPAGSASRPALVRRLYYDLTGLPPTPDQVDAFVNDSSESALYRNRQRCNSDGINNQTES